MKRNRIIYAVLIVIVIALGLASRSESSLIPAFIKEYGGDTLWAIVVYLTAAFLFPEFSIKKVAVIAALFSFIIELSQLYHAPWIERIRHFRLGGLVLGFGFLWSDLICYAAGISIAVLLEWCAIYHPFSKRKIHSN